MDWRIQRLLQTGVTVYFVMTISFVLIRFMPGSPIDYIIAQQSGSTGVTGQDSSPTGGGQDMSQLYEMAEIYLNMNLSDPLHIAYFDYMVSTFQGDLGESIQFDGTVAEIMAEAMPWTLFVLSWGLFIGFFIGIFVGALMAYWEGGKLDLGLTTYSVVMASIPYYVLAILLVTIVAYRWGWFPTGGRQPPGVTPGLNWPFISGIIHYGALPILSTIVLSGIASLGMRGNSIRVLGEDYLRVARLRGLSDTVIATKYVARNAVLPMYTGMMISVGSLFGGSVILEVIFTYRGMGWYMVEATHARDYPLMMGGFMVITVAVVIALLITDLTYSMIDPRARGEDRESF